MPKQHPEQGDDELYMGNTDVDGFHKSDWRTKRMGHVARYADGRVIENQGRGQETRPWFIRASEVEQAIAREESAKGPNYEEKIGVYRHMLKERG